MTAVPQPPAEQRGDVAAWLAYRARLAVAMPLVVVGLLLEDFGHWMAWRGDRLARLATRIEGDVPAAALTDGTPR